MSERPRKGFDEHRSNGRRSTPELVKSIAGDTATLVRKEVELARQEIVEGVMAKVKGVGAFGVAGILGLMSFVFFGITLGASLKIWLAAWAAWLITAGVFVLLGGIAALFGLGRFKRASIGTEKTKRTVKEDLEWARTQLKR